MLDALKQRYAVAAAACSADCAPRATSACCPCGPMLLMLHCRYEGRELRADPGKQRLVVVGSRAVPTRGTAGDRWEAAGGFGSRVSA